MIYSRTIDSPLGTLTLSSTDKGLRRISFESFSAAGSDEHPLLDQCEKQLNEYFAGERKQFSLPLDPEGTEFQKSVWNSLSRIPFGSTISYKEQAVNLGRPSSLRAVAAANGKNPLAIGVPCHRVIASTGHLHGYAGGIEKKRQLLQVEGFAVQEDRVLCHQ